MDYRCIKKYPSIIEVGDIAKLESSKSSPCYMVWRGEERVTVEYLSFVQDYPEFWEKIEK